jgi:diaminopimelate epimerase
MKCHLYDAAGNRILWLDLRSCGHGTSYDQLKLTGLELSRRFQRGQDLTAVLFGSAQAQHALFWNADGSYEMVCGNAIRCLAHFVCDDSVSLEPVSVETPRANYLSRKIDANHGSAVIPGKTIRVLGADRDADLFVDIGTPHRIRLVNEEWLEDDLIDAMSYSSGPDPVNFNLVRKVAPFRYRVRTFERGVGETSSCGTAAASIVAALELRDAPSMAHSSHHLEFASGEQLVVTHDLGLNYYEISGVVTLMRDLSVEA